jgi:hypothetical protein
MAVPPETVAAKSSRQGSARASENLLHRPEAAIAYFLLVMRQISEQASIETMKRGLNMRRQRIGLVAWSAVLLTCTHVVSAAPDYTNVRYTPVKLGSPDSSYYYDADPDDAAVFKKAGIHWRGGVPFFIHGRKGVLKTKAAPTTPNGDTVEVDLLTTDVPKAVGAFLLVATTGTRTRQLTSLGKIEYEFSDGTTQTGNVLTTDHYEILDEAAQLGLEIPEDESTPSTRYTTVNGHLARYHLSVLYHAFPSKTLRSIRVLDTPDEGEGAETADCPIWIYGVTIATEP